jgi:apolipoprotein N-acyltransferase
MASRRSRLLAPAAAGLATAAAAYFGTGLEPVAWLVWLLPLPALLLAPRVSAVTAGLTAFGGCLLGMSHLWPYLLGVLGLPLPAAAIVVAGSAVTFAVAVLLFRALLLAGRPLLAAVSFPAVWVASVYLASLSGGNGATGTLAVSQAGVGPVLRLASATGVWGVDFLLLWCAAVVAAVAASTQRRRLVTGSVGLVVAAAALGYGWAHHAATTGTVRIGLLAANRNHYAAGLDTPQGRALLAAYADRLGALPADGTSVYVLPETAFAVRDTDLSPLTGPLGKVADRRGATIVVGVQLASGAELVNAAVAVAPGGAAPLVYRKRHPVPGDEADRMRPGTASLRLPATAIAVAICADLNYPRTGRDNAAAGAGLIVAPASDEDVDGWQHSRIAAYRGVESGVSIAWAARKGRLMLSGPDGRLIAETRTGGDGFATVAADVPIGAGDTWYARWGDWFAWLCLAAAALGIAVAAADRIRRPRPESTEGRPSPAGRDAVAADRPVVASRRAPARP